MAKGESMKDFTKIKGVKTMIKKTAVKFFRKKGNGKRTGG